MDGRKEDAFEQVDIETVETYSEMASIIRMMQIANSNLFREDEYEDNSDSEEVNRTELDNDKQPK